MHHKGVWVSLIMCRCEYACNSKRTNRKHSIATERITYYRTGLLSDTHVKSVPHGSRVFDDEFTRDRIPEWKHH
eukprot:4042485-Pleurochrysis_carterae.AAC.1